MQSFFESFAEFFQKPIIIYSLIVVVIMVSGFLVSRILRMAAKRLINKSSLKLNVDPKQYNFLLYAINLVIFIAALILIFYSIPGLKPLGITLFASAGFITAILLFAPQQALSNIVSGVFIVGSKPFRIYKKRRYV